MTKRAEKLAWAKEASSGDDTWQGGSKEEEPLRSYNHALKITVTHTVRLRASEIQRKRRKGRLISSHKRLCAYNSEHR